MSVKIIVIHDDIVERSPIMVTLEMKYGKDNIVLYNHSQQGLDYVLKNLGQKMVVLLDKNFYDGKEKSGIQVFQEIREKTALVYVILTSVSKLSDFDDESLKSLINNELFAFESFTSDYSKIIELITKAVENLEIRVDAVLEDWISKQSIEKRESPYLKTKDGKTYTLNDILDSIRQQTKIGKQMERNILKLAVDLLARQKTKLDD